MTALRSDAGPTRLEATVAAVRTGDADAAARARVALDAKAKPRRSLGGLEDLVCRLASIRRTDEAAVLPPAVVVVAADHGVAVEGVSAYPQDVTAQMLATVAAGGAGICVLAREAGARLTVVDVGVRAPEGLPGVRSLRVRAGTGNLAREPAMTIVEAEQAVSAGIDLAEELVDEGIGVIALGEIGIAGTTAASALTAALLGVDPATVCGRGTGLDDAGLERKVRTVRRALDRAGRLDDPMTTLAEVGGLEIAVLAGVCLGAAARNTPVLLDGFITSAAALVACRLCPPCGDAMVAAHRSPEPGHAAVLDDLGLDPLLDLGLRLGEGTGAALALPLVASAMAVLSDMATFAQAGVADTGA